MEGKDQKSEIPMLLLECGLSCEKETSVIIWLDNEEKAKYNSKTNELRWLAKLPLRCTKWVQTVGVSTFCQTARLNVQLNFIQR